MLKWMSYCIAFLILICTGCTSSQKIQKEHKIVRINIERDASSLDPRKARDLCSQTLVRMFFEGLTRVGKEEKAELALADTISISSDLKTYTFHLKEARWSNGDPVTSHDFIYAWKTLLDPQFPSDTAFNLYVIKGAKAIKEGQLGVDSLNARAIDEKTLEVELEYSVPYFLELLSVPAFFPINAKMDRIHPHWADNPSSFVCNGPFRISEWKHNDCIIAIKNPTYWDADAVQLSSMQFVMVNTDTELKMFEKGELDWAGSPLGTLPVEAILSLKKEPFFKTKEMLATYFIRVNTEAHPLNDAMIRRSLALAINRKEIVEHITQGGQIPASGIVPLSFGLQQEPYFQDGSVEEARALFNTALQRLQLDIQSFPEIKLLYTSNPERNHLIAQAIQHQWFKAFGIHIKLEACERKVYFDRLSKQDFHLASGSWFADFNDPINFLDVFRYKKGSSNNTKWENADYAEWLNQSAMTVNLKERSELLRQSEKLLIEEMPILPIFYYTMLYVQKQYLKDVVLSPMGVVDFKWAKVDKKQSG